MSGDLRGVGLWGGDDDGEVELSLGLAIGGSGKKPASFRGQVNTRSVPDARSSDTEAVDLGGSAAGNGGHGRSSSPPVDPRRRREMHALRRQEARKKRDEKQQRKGISRGSSTTAAAAGFYGGSVMPPARTCSLDDRMLLESQEYRTRARDREAREEEEEISCRSNRRSGENHDRTTYLAPFPNPSNPNTSTNPNLVSYAPHTFPMMPMQQQYPYHHYVPFANGFGFPYVMPHLVPAISPFVANAETNVFQPVACRAFQPFSPAIAEPKSTSSASNGNAEEMNGGNGDGLGMKRTPSLTGSMGSSSSVAVSDYRSGSLQGGSSSCDTRSHSTQALMEKPSTEPSARGVESTIKLEEPTGTKSSTKQDSAQSIPRKLEGSVSVGKNISASEKSAGPPKDSTLPLMPCVSTTGNGPNGKTITGFLYRYTKTEVSIMCVCHGSSFTPAEFVKHAGGTDISHPLRHIVVVSS